VCRGHNAPLDGLVAALYDRPPLSLTIGSRGSGKSFLAALGTHIDSQRYDRLGTRILGGSLAQSQQIYSALSDFDHAMPGAFQRFGKESARYHTGSEVAILAASSKSVRGPHVASLKLDEVDEIDPELREAAMGMNMAKRGISASASLMSTWHRLGGPMTGLIEEARNGRFPLHVFCLFEVLERCPESRSGPQLERCGECPLQRWCHATVDPGITPKAKRSRGHYTIASAIQKVIGTSLRIFESDYLCAGPKADGVWFPTFSPATHVAPTAEYDPALPAYLAIDSGVFTGAVFFQVKRWIDAHGQHEEVCVFGDYLAEGKTAEVNARALLELARVRCNGRLELICTDPAGGARNPVGPTVIAEYERVGLKPLRRWPVTGVSDGLALLDSFLRPAAGPPCLIVHPRCLATIAGLGCYRRAKRQGQFQDYPEDPQHPAEDLVDALRGGLTQLFPHGRKPPTVFRQGSSARIGY
jgi:hypothetical protein